MDYSALFTELEQNKFVFQYLLLPQDKKAYLWRPNPEHWCLLEIICHLYDEEREDFRIRLKTTLERPGTLPPPFDPVAWVKERDYISRNYEIMVHKFLEERTQSVKWLRSLINPKWDNAYEHPTLGSLSAHFFISNWLAHDYLHIRQIVRIKHQYTAARTGADISYAGNW